MSQRSEGGRQRSVGEALPPFIREDEHGVVLSLKVQPRASRSEIGEAVGDELKIKVTAPPVDSAANEAVVELLAATLDVPKSAVLLVRGGTSRHKVVAVRGISGEEAARRVNGNVERPTSNVQGMKGGKGERGEVGGEK